MFDILPESREESRYWALGVEGDDVPHVQEARRPDDLPHVGTAGGHNGLG